MEAAEILREGGLVAFPTETVYGLGANALDEAAARKIYEAKGRPSDNPLIAHVADPEDVEALVEYIPENGRKLMEAFWPGPLTMIFPKSPAVPYGTTGGLDTVAIRMPSDPVANRLIALAHRHDYRRRSCGHRRGVHHRGRVLPDSHRAAARGHHHGDAAGGAGRGED